MIKKIFAVVFAVLIVFSLTGCTGFLTEGQMLNVPEDKNPTAEIVLEYANRNDVPRRITLEFQMYYSKAPSTVANFIQLSESGFYNNKVMHNATALSKTTSELQYIGGGLYSVQSDGLYKKETKNYTIKGEFEANKWVDKDGNPKNNLVHQLGSLVMDRTKGPNKAFDSASTEFYVALNGSNSNQGNYAVFGQLISCKAEHWVGGEDGGWEGDKGEGFPLWFLEEMSSDSSVGIKKTTKDTTDDDTVTVPEKAIKITSVKIDKKGIDYSKAKVAKIGKNLND